MSSRHLTPLMLPTSLQPPLTGPRDVAHVTVHRIADDEHEPAAPAPAPNPPKKGKAMATSDQRVIDTLREQGSMSRSALEAATGLDGSALVLALKRLKHAGIITGTGANRNQTYSLDNSKPGLGQRVDKHNTRTGKASSKPAHESFAAGVKARERELEEKTRSNGTDLPARLGVSNDEAIEHYRRHPLNLEATAMPCRAIAKADGGAIILRGNQLTAELNAEELNVIHQLRA